MVNAGVDVVHVLTPPSSHASIVLRALELGCHVLVEKPLAVEVEDCERIAAAAEEKGLQVCVNHSLLFDPHVRGAIKAVKAGKIGKVVSVDILRSSNYPPYAGGPLAPHMRGAGYPFRDLGVHALYLFQELLGPVEDVQASWTSMGGEPSLAFDEWRAMVRCRDGIGQFQLSWNVKPLQNQIIIQGTAGVMRVDLFLMFQSLRASTPLPKPVERIVNAVTEANQQLIGMRKGVIGFIRKKVLPYHGLQDLIAEFYRALDTGDSVPVPARDVIPVVDWTERVARAADADFEQKLAALPTSDSVPILVTGASGGLGSAVVERLLAQGHRLRIFVRRIPARIPEGVEVAIGNLGDPDAVDRAVQGAKAVIHVGAAMKGGWDDHYGGTVMGTRNVVEACRKHGVDRLVHISSMSVVDWAGAPAGSVVTESTALEPNAEARGAYTRAKLEAEQIVVNSVKEHGLPAVILRPGLIFGGRIPLMTPAIGRKMGKRWLILGDGRVNLPLVYIDDVVDAVCLALDGKLHRGEIIQLIDDRNLTQRDVIRLVAGPDAKVVRIPKPVLFALGKLSEKLLGLMGRQSPLSAYRLRSALANRTFRSENAERLLLWEPRVGVCNGIKIAAADYSRLN